MSLDITVGTKESSVYNTIGNILSNQPDGICFSDHVITHMEALEDFKMTLSNSAIGRAFEYIFIDALLKQGIEQSNLTTNLHIVPHKKAELDILISNSTGFMLKTSVRERWKQTDRDGLAIDMYCNYNNYEPYTMYCLTYKEYKNKPDYYNIKATKAINKSTISNVKFVSILEKDIIDSIIESLVSK